MSNKLLEKIFSVKNDKDRKHKVVNMLGAKIKLKKFDIDYYTYEDTVLSTNFIDRIKILIKNSVPYYYPEKRFPLEYIPNFKHPIKVDTNNLRNYIKYKKVLKKFYRFYNVKSLEKVYNNLSDFYSKEVYLNIIVHQLFETIKTRFPIYYAAFYDYLDRLVDNEKPIDNKDIPSYFSHIKLNNIGYNANLMYDTIGTYTTFALQQYSYKNKIKAQQGDYVIDGGACYGDSAIYFASLVGDTGQVFSFEFIKNNIPVFYKNMELNPNLKTHIQLIERPLWSDSKNKLYPVVQGPGSYVSTTKVPNAYECQSISIDEFVKENNIKKIDFIKLDIEGSELACLKGAFNTIKEFQPKLAICIYHKKEDLWEIPEYLMQNFPNYNLYINHYSCNYTESVLFAISKDKI